MSGGLTAHSKRSDKLQTVKSKPACSLCLPSQMSQPYIILCLLLVAIPIVSCLRSGESASRGLAVGGGADRR
jgi:hypothetical protein